MSHAEAGQGTPNIPTSYTSLLHLAGKWAWDQGARFPSPRLVDQELSALERSAVSRQRRL